MKIENKETADFVARVAFKSMSELTRLIPILKETLPADEYEPIMKSISKIAGLVGTEILFGIFDQHPDIDERIKITVSKFGKLP